MPTFPFWNILFNSALPSTRFRSETVSRGSFSPQEVAKLTEHPDGETSTFDAPEYRPPPEKLQLAKGLDLGV